MPAGADEFQRFFELPPPSRPLVALCLLLPSICVFLLIKCVSKFRFGKIYEFTKIIGKSNVTHRLASLVTIDNRKKKVCLSRVIISKQGVREGVFVYRTLDRYSRSRFLASCKINFFHEWVIYTCIHLYNCNNADDNFEFSNQNIVHFLSNSPYSEL